MEIIGLYLFVIGSCIGSFINVLIYRLPLNQSIVYPYSSCTKCNAILNGSIIYQFLVGYC